MRVLLKIAYLGTKYHGWQVQPNGITVQEAMQNALEELYGLRPALTGCSRTDSGVHAKEFYCHYDVDKHINERGIVGALNIQLPDDITVLSCSYVDDDFHARYSSKGKNYEYRICNASVCDPFSFGRCWHIPKKLDVDLMNSFLVDLVGTNDFSAFAAAGRTVEDTVRTISECFAVREGDDVCVSVTADGFLYNMVRIITGTAVDVSFGKIDKNSAKSIIESRDRSLAGRTAPPQGLFLNKVFY